MTRRRSGWEQNGGALSAAPKKSGRAKDSMLFSLGRGRSPTPEEGGKLKNDQASREAG